MHHGCIASRLAALQQVPSLLLLQNSLLQTSLQPTNTLSSQSIQAEDVDTRVQSPNSEHQVTNAPPATLDSLSTPNKLLPMEYLLAPQTDPTLALLQQLTQNQIKACQNQLNPLILDSNLLLSPTTLSALPFGGLQGIGGIGQLGQLDLATMGGLQGLNLNYIQQQLDLLQQLQPFQQNMLGLLPFSFSPPQQQQRPQSAAEAKPSLPGTSVDNPLLSVVIGTIDKDDLPPAVQPERPSPPTNADFDADIGNGFGFGVDVDFDDMGGMQVDQEDYDDDGDKDMGDGELPLTAVPDAFANGVSVGMQQGPPSQIPVVAPSAQTARQSPTRQVTTGFLAASVSTAARRNAGMKRTPRGPKTTTDRSSKFRGVTKHRRSGRFEAHIWVKDLGKAFLCGKRRQLYLGGYSCEEHAAEAYDIAALKCKGTNVKTNFELSKYEDLLQCIDRMSMEELVMAVRRQSQGFSRGTSSFRGVTKHPSERWEARIGVPGAGSRHVYLGLFAEEKDAAKVYDQALVRLRGRTAATNFSLSDYTAEMSDYHKMQAKLLENDARYLEIQSNQQLFERWVKSGNSGFPDLEQVNQHTGQASAQDVAQLLATSAAAMEVALQQQQQQLQLPTGVAQ